ncbi:MAG: hypothetical protein H7096_02930 [Flavobacterium sp.]|nr:hypothetical protein [Pedobacter sp.]
MIQKLLPALALIVLALASCSTNRIAQQKQEGDDAYYTEAQAREQSRYYAETEESEPKSDYVTDDELYGDNNSNRNNDDYEQGYYDGSYSDRINRFRNYSPWRNYYDNYYGYGFDPYFNNFNSFNYYNSPGIYIGIGRPFGYNFGYSAYNPWNFYGSQYYDNYWGPYSFYNTYNPYGNGFYGNNYGGGYYGNVGRPIITNPNYRTRPNRETENVRTNAYPTPNGRIGTAPNRPERVSNNPSNQGTLERPDRADQPAARPTRSNDGRPREVSPERSGSSRPAARPTEARPSRPQRESSPPPRIENRPAERQSSPPPSSAPSRSSNENNGRPSRGN